MRRESVLRTAGGAALFLALCLCGMVRSEEAGPGIDEVRAALQQWVETERLLSREKRDAALAREMLNQRITLVEREIEVWREKVREADKSIAETDKAQTGMAAENRRLREASVRLEGILLGLEARTRALLPRLPAPIRERLQPLSQRIPADASAETRLTLAERFQNVVGILNELNKADRDVLVCSEVRELPDGSAVQATVVYLGLAQGYYVAGGGGIAGVGFPMREGWLWKSKNEAAAEIARAIAILQNEQVASFVHLPVEIQ
ncbi:DUF3450 family protein [bacterium]|nr:DUF3450 family protein [bacterium]